MVRVLWMEFLEKGLLVMGVLIFFISIGGRGGDPLLYWFLSDPSLATRVGVVLVGSTMAVAGFSILGETRLN